LRPDGFTFVREAGGIREYRLDANGLQVLFLRHGVLPVVTFMVTYRVGSRNETAGLSGATHFLEHLMFKGTERFNRRNATSVFEVLQRVGAQVNATTWFDRTNYYEQLPAEHLDVAVSIEADRMRGVLLRAEDVEAERTVILNEYDRGENDPYRRLFHEVWSTAFRAHPYGTPTIGWRSDIEKVTADELRGFYDTFYYPENATVSVIGGVEESSALDMIRRHFDSIAHPPVAMPEVRTVEPPQRGERRVEVHMPGEVGAVLVVYKAGRQVDPTTIPLDVAATLLADGKTSRLYRALVDEGLAASVSASCTTLYDPGLFHVYASCVPGVPHDRVESVILDEIERLRTEAPTPAEVRHARTLLTAQMAFARDGSFMIASQLNEAIASGDWSLYPAFLDRVARVTGRDIQEAAAVTLDEMVRTVGWYVPYSGEAK
jgi:zinc protease